MSRYEVVSNSRENLPAYKYETLKSDPSRPSENRNLRLLQLKPAPNESVELNCTLIIVNVDNAPAYEALSWCWGTEPRNHRLAVSTIGPNNVESMSVIGIPDSLVDALKALRYTTRTRTLWIDLICINQEDKKERNAQVSMMHRIYGNATNVCIWLDDTEIDGINTKVSKKKRKHRELLDGSSDEDEKRRTRARHDKKRAEHQEKAMEQDRKAIEFIRHEVLGLWQFDELCKNKARAEEWAALLSLMRKPWFSRRWVVQEIAQAKHATLHTRKSQIPWREFVDAVSLFVEVEDATRRLTEIMQQHEVYNLVPDFFEDLSAIGASLLVQATSNLYRGKENGKRDSQRSLEYLVSALPVFDVTDPRDAVYALLGISKDSTPLAANQDWSLKLFQRIFEHSLDKGLTRKTFRVDYTMKVVDVFQEFVAFAIHRSMDTDPERALDILCRPWAPSPGENRHHKQVKDDTIVDPESSEDEKLPSWILGPDQAAFKIFNHPLVGRRMGRINADPLVGLPDESRIYRAAESKVVNREVFKFKKCNSFYGLFIQGFQLDTIGDIQTFSQNGQIPWDWIKAADWDDTDEDSPPEEFWRTLVADRSQYGRNAPPFFERACHESVKRERYGETIDTKKLITEGRCSIVAAFLRRVQAVIWNRRLAKAARTKRFCMTPKAAQSGDMICILYGCSVPVVLRPHIKTDNEMEDETRCDEVESNKPRENAARKIAETFRKKKARQEMTARENENKRTEASEHEIEYLAKKRARWEKINVEIEQIIEEEKTELNEKIKIARKKPRDDPSRQYFEFIGPCYVHGMMNGEAIEEQNNLKEDLDSLKSRVFELH